MKEYPIEIVNPVELASNIHERLIQLIREELNKESMPAISKITALSEADSILIEELKKLTERVKQEVLHGKVT